jgi:hypothetical protein
MTATAHGVRCIPGRLDRRTEAVTASIRGMPPPGIHDRFIWQEVIAERGLIRLEIKMKSNVIFAATGIAAMLVAVSAIPTRVQAQSGAEAELIGFHQLCDKGDRRACVRFGILIGQNQQRHADWRKSHAEWFWWEK